MKPGAWWTLALLAGCGRGPVTAFQPLALNDPAGPVRLVREAKDSAGGGYDLFHPARPLPLHGSVWVIDAGNDQLVRFDSTLSSARAFAREGEGPGELRFPQDLRAAGAELVVAESGNGRISIFDTAGAFRRTHPVAQTPRLALQLGGRLLATPDASPAYAYRVDERGALDPLARIPDAVRRLAASDAVRYLPAGPALAATPAGELLVLDQSVLSLSRFDADGRLLASGPLPDPFRARLLEQRIARRRSFGRLASAFVDMPAAKSISVGRDGRALILFALPDAWGLLVDPRAWTARPLLLPEEARLHDLLWGASDAALDGDRLYLISGSQLYELAVEGW